MRPSTVALLGTARNDFVIAAAGELSDAGARVTVLIRRGREDRFLHDGVPVRTFPGRISWYNFRALAAIRRVGATRIAVVVGDLFAHANVTTALNWWRAAGLLRGADIFVSSSMQPAVLECFNTIDQRQWLAVAAVAVATVVLALSYPAITLLALAIAGVAELAARRTRRERADESLTCPAPAWPILVDDPHVGWRLRPANITARCTTPDTAPRTIRVTIDTDGQRRTGAAPLEGDSRSAIAFYGGSYVFGDSLSDEETMPWHAATLLTQHRVLNRAVPGYSSFQILTCLLDDIADQPPAAAVVIFDGSEPVQFSTSGHARFPLSEQVAVWSLARRAWNRRSEHRGRARALQAVSVVCARHGIPVVMAIAGDDRTGLGPVLSRYGFHWTAIDAAASHQSTADRLARELRAPLEHVRPL